jgi:3-oxoacyl-[acyl-carrier protein] reductase
VVTILQSLGVKVITVQADAGSATFGEDLIRAVVKAFPGRKIDIIVNNAGHATFQDAPQNTPPDDFDATFHPNVRGPHLLIKAALPHLSSPGGRIINIGSIVARTGTKNAAFYSSSKAALSTLSLAWAEELGEKGITVNVISVGPTNTDYAPPEEAPLTQKFRAQQYIKRNGTIEEVAHVILFAASPGSTWVTGQELGVDGGLVYA